MPRVERSRERRTLEVASSKMNCCIEHVAASLVRDWPAEPRGPRGAGPSDPP